MLKNGSVKLQGTYTDRWFYSVHDLFTQQAVRDASAFLLRMIVDDYGREGVIKILRLLREAATTETVLIID